MNFEDFIKKGLVKKKDIDKNLAKSLIVAAESDLKFLKRNKIDDVSARKMVSGYYDVLRELLEAMAALSGYKIYSHEAFFYFLEEKGEDVMGEKFNRFRLIRNRVNYYGKTVSPNEAEEYCLGIGKMIKYFMRKLNDEI